MMLIDGKWWFNFSMHQKGNRVCKYGQVLCDNAQILVHMAHLLAHFTYKIDL